MVVIAIIAKVFGLLPVLNPMNGRVATARSAPTAASRLATSLTGEGLQSATSRRRAQQ
jgi:hypothetical protein